MRTITLSAEDALIEGAERRAQAENTTLDDAFRRWLVTYVEGNERAEAARTAIHELRQHVRGDGRKFTRDELNERR